MTTVKKMSYREDSSGGARMERERMENRLRTCGSRMSMGEISRIGIESVDAGAKPVWVRSPA